METEQTLPSLADEHTEGLVRWAQTQLDEAPDVFAAARRIVTRLGAQTRRGIIEFGFWAPELRQLEQSDASVWLEIFRPVDPIDVIADRQNIRFHRTRLPLQRSGDFLWAAVEGARAGTRHEIGDFYWVRYRPDSADDDAEPAIMHDLLAESLPLGAFAPAELYAADGLFADRPDADYFHVLPATPEEDGALRISPPVNILQIHPGTASLERSLAGLARVYAEIIRKIDEDKPLNAAEQHFVGYDAVQLTPVEPGIEFEDHPGFWQIVEDHPDSDLVTVSLQRPNMTSWGYDAILSGATAVNPVLLESKRPDELLDLIATLHAFPGGIKVILDINLGHVHDQALALLNQTCLADRTQYGQRVNVEQPVVRALLLEILERKLRYGVDGIRIDEAQEIQRPDPQSGSMRSDRELLGLMSDVSQTVAGVRYRPWMVFEDGSPWPQEADELSATFREVNDLYPGVWQLSPLSVEGNVPYRLTYWLNKWWRVQEMMIMGERWVTGTANHDTLRRAAQIDPATPVNRWLGASLPAIFANGFDNPAVWLLTYAMLPGVPMDFISASLRAPWTFIRNTDDHYSVKIVAEEAHFLDWAVTDEEFDREDSLGRLKALGFHSREDLGRFLNVLHHVVQATEYDIASIVEMLNAVEPPLACLSLTEPSLKMLARAWMDDLFDYCNVWRFAEQADRARSDFNHATRVFRRARPWLMQNFGPHDSLAYTTPCNGTMLVHGLRRAPNDAETALLVANLEGAPRTVTPLAVAGPNLPGDGWRLALATPGCEGSAADQPIQLENGAGVVFVRVG